MNSVRVRYLALRLTLPCPMSCFWLGCILFWRDFKVPISLPYYWLRDGSSRKRFLTSFASSRVAGSGAEGSNAIQCNAIWLRFRFTKKIWLELSHVWKLEVEWNLKLMQTLEVGFPSWCRCEKGNKKVKRAKIFHQTWILILIFSQNRIPKAGETTCAYNVCHAFQFHFSKKLFMVLNILSI